MRGIKSYDEKQRREQRRRNHIAKDLASSNKYRQRIVPSGRKVKQIEDADGVFYEDVRYDEENDILV